MSAYPAVANEALRKGIVESRQDITSASIISKGKVDETYNRPDIPIPPEEDLKRMLLQTELLVGMITTNEKVVGKTRFIMISHANLTALIVPIKPGRSLIVVFTTFKDIEGLTQKLLEQVSRIT